MTHLSRFNHKSFGFLTYKFMFLKSLFIENVWNAFEVPYLSAGIEVIFIPSSLVFDRLYDDILFCCGTIVLKLLQMLQVQTQHEHTIRNKYFDVLENVNTYM